MSFFEKRSFEATALAAAAAVSLPLSNFAVMRIAPSSLLSITEMRLKSDEAVRTAGFLTMGMRRLAADLAFIDLLVYYGEWEAGVQENINESGGGRYDEMKDRLMRIMDLDPYFTYAVLYGSGSLAFNLDRPKEAADVLRRAMAYQPKQWKYRSYLVAISLKLKGNTQGLLDALSPMLAEPDCPTQLKNMLAFVNLKLGHRDAAIRIYKDILNSRDANYAHVARRMLEKLGVPVD